jgi:hypothetical protein
MGSDTKFNTYVEEVKFSRLLGRSMNVEANTKAMSWGSLMEYILYDLLSTKYQLIHKQTFKHRSWGAYWSGSPDLVVPKNKVSEIKCYYPKAFTSLSEALKLKSVIYLKKYHSSEFWQVVSNAVILNLKKAEIISYMPYKSELIEIIKKVNETDFLYEHDLNPIYYEWFQESNIEQMPYIPDNSKYSNINMFEFEVTDELNKELTRKVLKAIEQL